MKGTNLASRSGFPAVGFWSSPDPCLARGICEGPVLGAAALLLKAQRRIDAAGRLRVAVHQGDVGLGDLSGLDRAKGQGHSGLKKSSRRRPRCPALVPANCCVKSLAASAERGISKQPLVPLSNLETSSADGLVSCTKPQLSAVQTRVSAPPVPPKDAARLRCANHLACSKPHIQDLGKPPPAA